MSKAYCVGCGSEVKLNQDPSVMFEYECPHCGVVDYTEVEFKEGE